MDVAADHVKVVDAGAVDPENLNSLLRQAFSPLKCDFLEEHGQWQHRGNENRFVVLKGGQPVVYGAVIPTSIYVQNRIVSAAWYVDLFVHEDFRRQGLQQYMDERVKGIADILLGVPNEIAINMHRKNGWGVRDDYHVLMLPLRPSRLRFTQQSSGWRATALGFARRTAAPLAAAYRRRLSRFQPQFAWKLDEPDAESLALVFERYRGSLISVNRDTDFMRWRFLETPHRSELDFFAAGASEHDVSVVAVTRTFVRDGLPVIRILDIFGDLADRSLLSELIKLIGKIALKRQAVQINSIATNRLLKSVLKANGYVLSTPFRFCWFSEDKDLMALVDKGPCHWSYADSDNDSLM